jgi:hypothetical protein
MFVPTRCFPSAPLGPLLLHGALSRPPAAHLPSPPKPHPTEQELLRKPGEFVASKYDMTNAAENKEVSGWWSLERALRARLREELAAEAAPSNGLTPEVPTSLTKEEHQEKDGFDNGSRHILGKSERSFLRRGAAVAPSPFVETRAESGQVAPRFLLTPPPPPSHPHPPLFPQSATRPCLPCAGGRWR